MTAWRPMTDEKAQELKNTRAKGTASQSRAEVADSEIVGSQAEAALFLGKSTRTIRRYEKEGMPTAARNGKKVYIKSILLLYAANEGKKPTQAKTKKEEGSADLTATRAELAKMELETRRGEWIKKADYDRRDIERIQVVKKSLLGLPRKMVPLLRDQTPARMQEILKKEVVFIINSFANYKAT